MVESLLLAVTRVSTFADEAGLTSATGFFFERDGNLFLITNRHVVLDEATSHHPSRIEVEVHHNSENLAETTMVSINLYDEAGLSQWRECTDAGGLVDVAALKVDRESLPESPVYHAFSPEHLLEDLDSFEVGAPLLIVGFPLSFHDTLHHLPVARQATVASSFGIRFQGNGYFLTDSRTHRGTSGAPVVKRVNTRQTGRAALPWRLLGIHASRLDVARDTVQDEALGLNCAWYADVIMVLTQPPPPPEPDEKAGTSRPRAPVTAGR